MSDSSAEGRFVAAQLLIFGYGNPSRGDDALGPLLIERLENRLTEDQRLRAGGIESLTDFQLQVENALDLSGRRLVLFVDAHVDCPSPWRLSPLEPSRDMTYSTHAISPASVLRVYEDIHGQCPPPCFLLGVRGESFELGEPLSKAAAANLETALALVLALCAHPDREYWSTHCH